MNDETQRFDPQDINQAKGLSCLSYIGILFLIPMLVNQNSPYTKFHVNQGIVLFLFAVICGVAGKIIGFLPFVGWIIGNLLLAVVSIFTLVLAIMGIINAVQGRAVRLPLIGNIELYK